MFTGEYTHSLDAKGRVAFPRRLREAAGDETGKETVLYLCRGQGGCLYLYTERRWRSLVDSMGKPSFGAPDQVNFARLFFSTASEARLDGQGRIQVPDHLKALAGIGREVVFVGVYDRVELWDSTRWREFQEAHREAFGRMAEGMST